MKIIGGPEIYVRGRSKLLLKCNISPAIEEPTVIDWFHESKQFTQTGGDSRVRIQREKFFNNTAVSILEISGATAADTGRYSCNPFNLSPAEVTVHVVEGNVVFSFTSKSKKLGFFPLISRNRINQSPKRILEDPLFTQRKPLGHPAPHKSYPPCSLSLLATYSR